MPREIATPDRVLLLLNLVPFLIEHGPTPVRELAEAFEVDAEVIRGLAAFLGTAGVPGETRTYQPEDLFDIDWDALEERDIVSLTHVVAIDDTPRFSPAESAALVAGLHAISPLLPEGERATVAEAARKLGAAASSEGAVAAVSVTAEPEDPRLATILAAIDGGRRLAFDYRDDRGARTLRTVEPFELDQSGGAWYLRAHCLTRDAARTFMVDRMGRVRALAELAAGRAPREPRRGLRFDDAERARGLGVTARLRVTEAALHRLSEFAPRVVGECEGGGLRIEVDLAHPAVAVRLVRAAPGEAVVESPPEAREAVREWVDLALAHYDV